MTVEGKGEEGASWWMDSYEQILTFKTRISFRAHYFWRPLSAPWSLRQLLGLLVNEDLPSRSRKCGALEAVLRVPRGSLEKRNPRKHGKIKDSKWDGCWGLETHWKQSRAETERLWVTSKISRRCAPHVRFRTGRHAFVTHEPCRSRARRTRGWCFQSCRSPSGRAGAGDPPAAGAIQSHRLGGIGVVPGTVALEGRPGAVAGVQEFQGLGKGEGNLWNPTPLAKENFAGWWVGAASRAVIAGMCSHPLGGFAERLACEKEVRRGWGDVGRRRGTPGLERGSGCERPGSAASTWDTGAGVTGGADVIRKLAGVCLCFGPRQTAGWDLKKEEPGLAMSVSFHLYLKDNRNNNSFSSSCVSRFI